MRRRDFLGSGIAAGAGALLLAGQRGGAQAAPPSETLNVALIGVGAHGRALLNAALLIQGGRFRAVCDIWDQCCKFAQYYLKTYKQTVNAYADYREMLDKEKDLQAAIVATPDFVHAEQTIACLKAGLHVYCETPMAGTLDGARAMARTARETGKLLQIGYQRRSNPRYRHVHEKLLQEAKLLGRLTHADAQWCHRVADPLGWQKHAELPEDLLRKFGYASMHELRNWRWFRKLSAGLFPDLGAHQADVANWFLRATPRAIIAAGGVDFYKGRECHDNVVAILEYETPEGVVRALCRVLTTTSGSGNFETLYGTDGAIRISEEPKWTKVYREPHAPDWEDWTRRNYLSRRDDPATSKPLTSEEAHARETGGLVPYELPVALNQPLHQPHLENFFDAIRGKARLNCPSEEAFRTEVIAAKVTEAVEARKMLPLAAADYTV
jgi:predicted dehydrogenase